MGQDFASLASQEVRCLGRTPHGDNPDERREVRASASDELVFAPAVDHAHNVLTLIFGRGSQPDAGKMFKRIGLAEKEGTGFPTIYEAWETGKRRSPDPVEDTELNVVTVTLPLLSQMSPAVEDSLRKTVGAEYGVLSSLDKDILLHAFQFGETSQDAIHALRPADAPGRISARIRWLASRGWLKKSQTQRKPPIYNFAGHGALDGLFDPAVIGEPPSPPGGREVGCPAHQRPSGDGGANDS